MQKQLEGWKFSGGGRWLRSQESEAGRWSGETWPAQRIEAGIVGIGAPMTEWLWLPVALGMAGLAYDWYANRKPKRNTRADVLYQNWLLLPGDLEFKIDERDYTDQ
jgi:hypothetical protein